VAVSPEIRLALAFTGTFRVHRNRHNEATSHRSASFTSVPRLPLRHTLDPVAAFRFPTQARDPLRPVDANREGFPAPARVDRCSHTSEPNTSGLSVLGGRVE